MERQLIFSLNKETPVSQRAAIYLAAARKGALPASGDSSEQPKLSRQTTTGKVSRLAVNCFAAAAAAAARSHSSAAVSLGSEIKFTHTANQLKHFLNDLFEFSLQSFAQAR